MRLTLPCAAVRAATRLLVAPSLSPRLPLPVARRLLDVQGRLLPVPRGTRTDRTPTGLRVQTPGTDRDRRVLFLHGGGYLVGSPWSHRSLAAWLAESAGAPVDLLDYRLAPEHPYPAGLDDAEQAYVALLRTHSPQHLALAGDSAGGGLVLALLLRLRDKGIPLPATVGLISPWVDLSLTDPHIESNAASDAMLGRGLLQAGLDAYLGGRPVPAGLRPLEADLAGLPPVHVLAGADEVLVGDADRLVERLERVTYRRSPGMWHDHALEAGLLDRAHADVRELGLRLRRDLAARRVRVAVVGAGFGGIGMGTALREDDLGEVTVLEKAPRPGGVWRDNTYPGAACDVPSNLYSYTFAAGEWSRRFAPQPDILRYLEGIADDLPVRYDTEVRSATWDASEALWRLDTASGEVQAEALVTACGQLSHPAVPDLPGLDRFAGPVFHSARWDHAVDLRGKRIGVVGSGASAIQFVPAIAPDAAHVTVFQRSAPYVIPKTDGPVRRRPRALGARAARLFWTGFFEFGALGFTAVKPFARVFALAHHAQLRLQVPDADLRARLAPDYPPGCKRVLLSSDWFRAPGPTWT
jgi:acetyl esterase/lipase